MVSKISIKGMQTLPEAQQLKLANTINTTNNPAFTFGSQKSHLGLHSVWLFGWPDQSIYFILQSSFSLFKLFINYTWAHPS